MVSRLTGSGAGVEVVIGKAGAGKTFALDAARTAWQADGRRVVGTALAARAALELQDGAGIPSFTLDRLLADLDHPTHGGLQPGSVVVVDEAGMVGTRKLARLLDAAEHDQAKVVLVGDPHQLPEIDAGGALRGLANRLPVIELADNRRQTDAWERDALDELRDGDPTHALAAYEQHGRIHTGPTAEEVREQLVGDWWHAQAELGLGGVMVAARRSDVDDLNDRARARMATTGELHGPALQVAGREFQAGDRVLCRRNDRRLGVVNGTRATVTDVDPHQRTVTMARDDTGEPVALPAGYLEGGHLDHAYAITAHKAQGATVEATWVLGSDALYREWGYVALSRGRQANHLYLVDVHEPDGICHDPRPHPEAGDPLRQATADLRRSRAQTLALDHQAQQLARLDEAELRDAYQQTRTEAARVAATAREHGRLDEREQQLLAQRETARRQADQTASPARRWWRRRDRQDPAAERAQAAVELCDRQLDQLHAERAHLDVRSDGFDPAHLDALHTELTRRAEQRARAAEFDPPAYLAGVLGRAPDTPDGRQVWRQAATAVEAYRLNHGVDDPHQPLGPTPAEPAARREHAEATAVLQAARTELLDGPQPDVARRDLPDLEHAL